MFILHAGKVGTVFRHSWISAPCAPAHGDLWHSLAMSVGWKGSSIQPFLKDAGSEKGLWGWGGEWSTLLETKISIEKEGNYKAKAVGVIGACVVLSWKTFKAFLSSWHEAFFWL